MIPSVTRTAAALAALAVLLPGTVMAQDWASTLYTEGGVELRVDERVFTLFAALNALGFDDAPVSRKDPIAKREFDPTRQQIRDKIHMSPALRAKFEDFFDKHPAPIRTYLAYTLSLGEGPTFKHDKPVPAAAKDLTGFEALLGEFFNTYKVHALFEATLEKQRDTVKPWLPVVDKPLGKVRSLLKVAQKDDSPRLVLIVNLLDGRGAGHGIGFADEVDLVVGPSEAGAPNVDSAAKAYARVMVQDVADKQIASMKGAKELFEEVKDRGVGAFNAADYVAENLARAIAVRAAAGEGKEQAALDGQFKAGFVLIKDMTRGLALFEKSGKALPVFFGDYLREVDTSKAIRALRGD